MAARWRIRGEIVLSCNCDVFCPCVVSLGTAKPSHGVCHTWYAINIHEGNAGRLKLDGLKVAVLMDVPGALADGGWTVGLYVDEKASPAKAKALEKILSGKAGGPISWFSIMIADFLGTKHVPISFEKEGRGWRVGIPKIIDGHMEPIKGRGGTGVTKVTNSGYWMAPDIVVCSAKVSRYRDWGRNWNLEGQSGEYAKIDWQGP